MPHITYDLDEFEPFQMPNGDRWVVNIGNAKGSFCVIEYESRYEWSVYSITIDSGKYIANPDGSWITWQSRPVTIDDKHPLWSIIERALETHYRADVERAIADDIGDCGDDNAEHRHSHNEYGLAR